MSVEDGKTEEKENKKSCCSFTSCFYGLMKSFMIGGQRRVRREKLTKEDFELPDSHKIATYDPNLVTTYWNDRNRSRKPWKIFSHLFFKGVYAKLIPVTLLYLALYYVLIPFVIL